MLVFSPVDLSLICKKKPPRSDPIKPDKAVLPRVTIFPRLKLALLLKNNFSSYFVYHSFHDGFLTCYEPFRTTSCWIPVPCAIGPFTSTRGRTENTATSHKEMKFVFNFKTSRILFYIMSIYLYSERMLYTVFIFLERHMLYTVDLCCKQVGTF